MEKNVKSKKQTSQSEGETFGNGRGQAAASTETGDRIQVMKTYKLFVNGAFPRSESGYYYKIFDKKKNVQVANVCKASRKDLRDAIVAARGALAGWSNRPAMNRGQIFYRMAEMLEGRRLQFITELMHHGHSENEAEKEVNATVDRCIYYAGWCDKFQQIFSTVNPVASSHFSFSMPEDMGCIVVLAPEDSPLLGFVTNILTVIAGGNACVILAAENSPLPAISFAEVLHSSDLPGGVVNILTGSDSDLLPYISNHMDINGVVYCRNDAAALQELQQDAAINVKRIIPRQINYDSEEAESPYLIFDTLEIKTTWHPIENIGSAGAGY